MNPRHPACEGFTLVELSIVLAIIGVIIGGIVAGQYLVRQSALQSISSDLAKYKAAYFQFKSQYNGQPGDIRDATSNWDAAGGSATDNYTATCYAANTSTSAHTTTCNGDGDNMIDTGYETFLAWQQLADAHLIEGAFSGVPGAAGANDSVPGQNVPAGRIVNTGYNWRNMAAQSGATNYYNMQSMTTLWYGTYHSNNSPYNAALTTREMYGLDTKMDDGLPASGVLTTFKSNLLPGCTTSDTDASAAYALSTSGPLCSLMYMIDQ